MTPKKYWAKSRRCRFERLRLKRALVDMLGGKCIDCGYSAHLAALDFDHIDPSTKVKQLASMLSSDVESKIYEEARKCELRCANCHRVKTHPDATD